MANHPVYGVLDCLKQWGVKYIDWNFHMKTIRLPGNVFIAVTERGCNIMRQHDCGLGVGSGWITNQQQFVRALQRNGFLK